MRLTDYSTIIDRSPCRWHCNGYSATSRLCAGSRHAIDLVVVELVWLEPGSLYSLIAVELETKLMLRMAGWLLVSCTGN